MKRKEQMQDMMVAAFWKDIESGNQPDSADAIEVAKIYERAYQQGWQDADANPAWRSVNDELPEENGKTQQSVSAWATNGLMSCEMRYNFDTKKWTDMWGDPFDITHWMPLPTPPKNERVMNREEIINALSKLGQHEGHKGIDFNEWQAINAAIECLRTDGLWHPVSELPIIPKGESTIQVIAMWKFSSMPIKALCGKHGWVTEGVKWWCYPPEKEDKE